MGGASPFLIVCDHAGAATPRGSRRLGLTAEVFETHIAVDIGVAALGRRLGDALGACVVAQAYSRLLVDCNRAPDHPQSIPAVSDGVEIPGNKHLGPAAAAERLDRVFRPYHARIAAELDARLARGERPVLVCLHSFTPVLAGIGRPWHIGLLHEGNSPISRALLAVLAGSPGLVVGDNQPYAMDGVDYTAPVHAISRGLDYLEIEVRQDLIGDDAGSIRFADLLARSLPVALVESDEGPANRGAGG